MPGLNYLIDPEKDPKKKQSRGEELINYLSSLRGGQTTSHLKPTPANLSSTAPQNAPSNLSSFTRQLQEIGKWGDFHIQPPAPKISPTAIGKRMTGGGSAFDKFLRAIASQESGGNYGAVNRSSGALGKYQIMPGNVPSWARQILGRSVSPGQFLHNPKLQEQIARAKLLSYYKKYGARGAAEAWYGGPGSIGHGYVHGYSNSILRKMGLI